MTWTGSNENREIILQIYRSSFTSPARQFIINYGKKGSGKINAANHFTTNNPIPEIASNEQIISVLLSASENSFDACHYLISAIWNKLIPLKSTIAANIAFVGEENVKRILYERIGSFEFAQAIVKLCTYEPDTSHSLLTRYFFSGLGKEEMRFFKISRDINTWTERVRFLSGLMITLCLSEQPKRIFLWIDNAENSIFYPAREHRNFAYFVRDFSEMAKEFITIFLNYSLLTKNKEKADILIGEILKLYISRRIYFE